MNAKVSTKLIDVAGYLRMSSDKQDTSIADQRAELIAYAAKRGYRIVKWFTDEGISGWKNKQRHGFHALINDAPDGDFRGVLCWDQSRFSRFDPMEANYFWHILRTANVFIETCKEGRLDFESLGGWLSASVQQHAKSEYCKSLAADVVRGRRAQILAGKWISCPPYGYNLDKATGKLVLGNPEHIEVVRRIFTMRARGLGRRAICQVLNGEKIPGPRSAGWCQRQIANVLEKQTYLGHMVIGKWRTGKFVHISDFGEIRVFENTHPAIIDRDLWNRATRVTEQKTNHAEGRGGLKIGAQLSGLLHCGRCGRILFSVKALEMYVCSTYHTGAGCSHNRINHEQVHTLVADKVRELVLMGSVEKLTEHIERVLAKRKSSKVGIDSAAIKKQIAEIDRKLEGAAERMLEVEASLVKSVRAAMMTLQEKRKALEEKLADIQPAKKQKTAKEIAAGLWQLDKVLREGDIVTARTALQQIFSKIDVEYAPKKYAKRTIYRPVAVTLFFCPIEATSSRRCHPHWNIPKKPIRVELATIKQSG